MILHQMHCWRCSKPLPYPIYIVNYAPIHTHKHEKMNDIMGQDHLGQSLSSTNQNRSCCFIYLSEVLYHGHIYRPKLSFTLFNSCISSKIVSPCHFTIVGGDAYKSYVTQHPPIRLRLGTMSHALYNPQYTKSMVFFSPLWLCMGMFGHIYKA